MFKQTKISSIFISAKKGLFVYNSEDLPAGTEIQATITAIKLETDPGSKEHKIKHGERLIITLQGTEEAANFFINLNGFTGKKILCLLPSLESPFISIGMKKGNEEIPTVFIGSRETEESQKTNWHKTKFSFDSDGDLFNRETKETITAAEILESVADLINVPYIDAR